MRATHTDGRRFIRALYALATCRSNVGPWHCGTLDICNGLGSLSYSGSQLESMHICIPLLSRCAFFHSRSKHNCTRGWPRCMPAHRPHSTRAPHRAPPHSTRAPPQLPPSCRSSIPLSHRSALPPRARRVNWRFPSTWVPSRRSSASLVARLTLSVHLVRCERRCDRCLAALASLQEDEPPPLTHLDRLHVLTLARPPCRTCLLSLAAMPASSPSK